MLNDCNVCSSLEPTKLPLWTDDSAEFILKVFHKYGNGKTISLQGFENLLKEISLEKLVLHGQPVGFVNNSGKP